MAEPTPRGQSQANLGLPPHFSLPQGWRRLGRGQFGSVYLVFRTSPTDPGAPGEWVAVKIYQELSKLQLIELEYLRREVVCQRKLNHQHIIGFREVGITTDMRLYLALEYADSGNLREWLDARGGRLQEPLARWFLQQLVYGLDYAHAHGVFNRDIKPANLLLHGCGVSPEQPLLKVADFGLCKSTQESAPHSTVGSPNYMAPEVFSQRQYDGRKADIFSCGVVLYEMVFGVLPFTRRQGGVALDWKRNIGEILRNMQEEAWPRLLPPGVSVAGADNGAAPAANGADTVVVSPELMDLLRGMLRFDPAKRLSMHDIKRHAFYKQGLSEAIYQMLLADPAADAQSPQPQHGAGQSVELIEAEFERIMAHCRRLQEEAAKRALDEQFEA